MIQKSIPMHLSRKVIRYGPVKVCITKVLRDGFIMKTTGMFNLETTGMFLIQGEVINTL